MDDLAEATSRRRAATAGVLLGIGLGGFVDGIVLHQILQWHNMLSSVVPPTSMDAMRTNMTADGWFHAGVWTATLVGVLLLWSVARARVALPPTRWFLGLLLAGWGGFNLVEGIVDHQLLGLHHVRFGPDPVWDYGFLLVGGVAFLGIGWNLTRSNSGPE